MRKEDKVRAEGGRRGRRDREAGRREQNNEKIIKAMRVED